MYPFYIGSVTVDSLRGFVDRWRAAGWSEVWTPGCGLAPLGRLLAHFGMGVVASDVSPTAVAFQNSDPGRIDSYVEQYDLGPADPAGSFRAVVHDFRTPFADGPFDLIQNLNAFQGFSPPDLSRVAEVHARALKPGGVAIFDGIAQNEQQDAVERAVETAGLYLPMPGYKRRLREVLAAAGIPHAYVRIGYQSLEYSPTVPAVGEFADPTRRSAALTRLGDILRELEPARLAARADLQASWTPETKFAELLLC